MQLSRNKFKEWGRLGGIARKKKLSKKRRVQISRNAALAMHKKRKK